MKVLFCKCCSALMEQKQELNEWLKCISCGYHEKKSEEWLNKEKQIKEAQNGVKNENKPKRFEFNQRIRRL